MEKEKGLPRVEGLDKIFQPDPSLEKDPQQQSVQDVTAQQQVEATPATGVQAPSDVDWAQFKNPDGTLNQEALYKSYKEIQGAFTRVSQDNSTFRQEMQRLKEENELRSYQAPPVQPQQQKTFEQLFVENPEQAIAIKASEMANVQRINEVLEEKESENPTEFQERLAYVKMLAQNPQLNPLSYSPKGVKKLFEIADKTRRDNLVKTANKSLKIILGLKDDEDIDIEKFKAMVRKDQPNINNPPTNPLNAYMPNSGTSTRTGADINIDVNDLERQKQEAIKSGDVKKVAGALLKQALLK